VCRLPTASICGAKTCTYMMFIVLQLLESLAADGLISVSR
jgi:hypothetical protein